MWRQKGGKACFLGEKHGYPVMNYERVFELVKNDMPFATYIDIVTDILKIDDYYRTDTHWRQEKIVEVANRLALGMGMESVTMDSEKLYYLTNDVLEQCTVCN